MRTRLPSLRVVAAILTVAVGASGVAARVHQASVHHAYCAEHGVLEDRPGGESVPAPATEGAESARPDPGGGQPEHPAGHDACVFALALEPAGDSAVGPEVVAAPDAHEIAGVPAANAAPSALRVLSLAPKTSPPLDLLF